MNYRLIISLAILVIFYTVGYFGLTGEDRDYFAGLTPFTLILSTILLLVNYRGFQLKDLAIILAAAILGFTMEVVGVKTGAIFGNYWYGENLGTKWMEVPLTIGLNWALLTVCTMAISGLLFKNLILKSILGASLMVGLDFVMEPVAIKLDFWHWEQQTIPTQNYIAWFAIALVVQLIGHSLRPGFKNKFGIALYLVMGLFFTLLNFVL